MRLYVKTTYDSTDYGDGSYHVGLFGGSGNVRYPDFLDLIRIAESQGQLPRNLIDLYRLPFMGDGLLHRISYDDTKLELVIRCGCMQNSKGERVGYYDLHLVYESAVCYHQEVMHDIHAKTTFGRHDHDLMVFELQMCVGGRIRHNFVFHANLPNIIACFTIEADSIAWKTEMCEDRSIPCESIHFRTRTDNY